MGEDNRVALCGQRAHLGAEVAAGSVTVADGDTSSATSSAITEWVSAPTEIASTPVSATARNARPG